MLIYAKMAKKSKNYYICSEVAQSGKIIVFPPFASKTKILVSTI